MVTLDLYRQIASSEAIIGKLDVADVSYYTLEPPYREKFGAVPTGTYQITFTFSPRFQRVLPLLTGVNLGSRSGIRIHSGNRPSDTQGCILVGRYLSYEINDKGQRCRPYLLSSRSALSSICSFLKASMPDKILLNIKNFSDYEKESPFVACCRS